MWPKRGVSVKALLGEGSERVKRMCQKELEAVCR